jgi:glycosyltransferase involved in cell wall biosynthesis
MTKPIKLCHISTVHTLHDTRILYRECSSLVDSGYDVSLVITGQQDEVINGVKILHIKPPKNRFYRMLLSPLKAFVRAISTGAKVYHLHDPELIPMGLLFRFLGKKVIFDVHENITANIREKTYLPFRNQLAIIYSAFEWCAAKFFYLILAENSYRKNYEHLTKRFKVVLNTPDIEFFNKFNVSNRSLFKNLFYIGVVSSDRASITMIEVVKLLQARDTEIKFDCVGPAHGKQHNLIVENANYPAVRNSYILHGRLPLGEGYALSHRAALGIAILSPTKNYFESYPTKIFEYMAIGLPVVTSNFPLYRDVVEKYECGICVDPENPQQIADEIFSLLNDPERRKKYAENGYKAAREVFSWDVQRKELEAAYREIL